MKPPPPHTAIFLRERENMELATDKIRTGKAKKDNARATDGFRAAGWSLLRKNEHG